MVNRFTRKKPAGSDWFFGLILILAVVVAYQPVWYAGFIWDDDAHVTANPCIIGPLGLKEIWTTSAAETCPLTRTTFWVEHALWGLNPLPYHVVDVLMHGACAVALWRVLQILRVPGAWLGAALWALHPVQVESAAWITETKNTQSGLFFLLAILYFARWLKARELEGRTGRGWNYGLTLLFAALAMASKLSTVILPLVLCLCAWWMEGRWRWRNLARVAPVVLMAIAACAVSLWTVTLDHATAADSHWVRAWPERLAGAGDAVWFYLGKLAWPQPLITIYPRWEIINTGQWIDYLPLLAVIVILLILWLKHETWARPWFFVFAYFLIALLPVLGLADIPIFHYALVFDHFQYLAAMGPLALAGAGLGKVVKLISPDKPWLQSSLCGGVLLILGLSSWQRAWAYESEETLWTDTLAKNPACWLGQYNLGIVFAQKGQLDEAMSQFQKALAINPNYAEAHDNLGNAFLQKGQLDDAIAQYQRALDINSNYAFAHNNLGWALFQKGQVDKAMDQFQEALKANPDYAVAHYNLGLTLMQKQQIDQAIAQFQEAVRLKAGYVDAQDSLDQALMMTGQKTGPPNPK